MHSIETSFSLAAMRVGLKLLKLVPCLIKASEAPGPSYTSTKLVEVNFELTDNGVSMATLNTSWFGRFKKFPNWLSHLKIK